MRNSSAPFAIALCATLGFTIMGTTAFAEERPLTQDESSSGAGLRNDHITATGQTVPNPGAPQSAGTTQMDRGIQREDNKIQSSICKGC